MSYTIAFLNDEDFERLPGSNMASKVGVAYPKYQEAYVRKSGSNLVDVFSAMHELEHLEGSSRGEHFDSENQCYYKGFSDIFQPALTVLGSMFGGPTGGAIGNGIGGLFGGGSKPQQSQQSQMPNISMPSMDSSSPASPATSQASSGMGGASSGAVGGNAIKGLSTQPQFQSPDVQNQQYGTQAGRSPLMNAFGGM